MKVKFWDRLLIAVYAVLGALGSVGLALLVFFRERWRVSVDALTYRLVNEPVVIAITLGAALVLLLWSVWLLMLAFRREPRVDKSSVSVQHTESGSVRISVQAMDMLVRQAIGNTEGVVDVKTRIVNHEDSITVKVDMTLDSDVHIPNITMLMQRSIKNFIEEYSGIAVREVTILVSKIIEVTPHPPLQLENRGAPKPEIVVEPEPEPEVEPEPEAEAPAPAAEIEGSEPVQEYEADHEGESEPAAEETPEHISEKDVW